VAKTVFDVLEEKLGDAQRDQEVFLTSGGAKTLEAYKEACGVIRGLTIARREVQDLAKNYMGQEDD
jgi:hypothetical protein